jgi:tetratricopeptide (TPR) repeat protein
MRLFFLCLVTSVIFFGCATSKDVSISGQRDHSDRNLTRVETAIVPLEASGSTSRRQSEVVSARQMISSMEREASADADYSGRLTAWSGRLALLEGRYSEAQRLHRQSQAASPGNVPSIILGIRLEGDPVKRLEIIERELAVAGRQSSAGFGELQIERGRSLFELNRFSEAVGAYDSAFASGLNPVYNESYKGERDRAWELRNTTGVRAGTLNLLGRETITWNDCINIAANETQLLRFITGGRTLSEAELFNRLLERGFIPYTQDVNVYDWQSTRPRADEIVTRAGAAWFAWHLYAESRADRGLLTRYSARFTTGVNPRSPIADIPPLSPFFDSILGCVEREYLSLPDGRNFRPEQPIRGTELLSIYRKIDN